MSDKKPVVVYGASGYTGRLVCEYLREYELPFIAAGRNIDRLNEVMLKVPGIETAEYEVVQVEHTVEALTELFSGAKVVCNTVGPFEYYGMEVVEASLKAGCHYIDTTGEPQFMRMARDGFSDAYKAADLALAPSVAYMYAPLDICANYCLETEGIDSLEGVASASAIPTYASTQSIFALFKTPAQYLENNTWAEWPAGKGYETIVPGHAYTQLAHPWGGGSLPLWFEHDSRVRNCRQLTCFTNRPMFESVIELQQHYEANIKPLPLEEQEKALGEIADSMQPGEPPRENMLVHRTIDTVVGTGTAIKSEVTLQTGGAYFQTGIYQAAAAQKLINDGTMKAGFASPCQIVGHEYLLGQLRNFLPTELTIE
jgi:short subunit dehydrogenase-like uncharacterized protein